MTLLSKQAAVSPIGDQLQEARARIDRGGAASSRAEAKATSAPELQPAI